MVEHPRKAIRSALAALLTGVGPDYATACGARVFKNRVRPAKMPELPLLAVYTTEEDIDDDSKETSPRILRRVLSVVVEAIVKAVDDPDDALDDLCQQVEDVISQNPRISGLAAKILPVGTQISTWAEPSQQQYIVAVMTFEAEYDTDWPRAGLQTLVDLYRVNARLNLGGIQEPADETQAQATVQQPPPPEP